MEWILLALGAAFFTSMTTILAKVGIRNVNSNFATFYRTFIVMLCAVVFCFITQSFGFLPSLTWQNYLFLVLSGICTGCSWLCYYRALKLGSVNKVAPIDKSSFILTSILFLIFFFDSTTNNGNPLTISMLILSMLLMLSGTILMIGKQNEQETKSKTWFVFAVLSAVFASLVSFFVKVGLQGIPSSLGTLIRTIIVFIFAGAIVIAKKDYQGVSKIGWKDWLFLTLSGIATGGAWLLEYAALNVVDSNPVGVNSIVKLSILLTMAFSFFFLKEKFKSKTWVGLGLLTCGIVLIIVFSL